MSKQESGRNEVKRQKFRLTSPAGSPHPPPPPSPPPAMPRKDESADLTRIAIVNKDKCKPKKCKQVIYSFVHGSLDAALCECSREPETFVSMSALERAS